MNNKKLFLFIYFNVSKIHYFLSTRIFQTWMLALHLHLCLVLRPRRSILVQEVWRKRHKYVFSILYNIPGSFGPSSSFFCFLIFPSPAITLIGLNTPQNPAFHCHCQTTALQPTQALGPFVCNYYYFFNWIWNPFEVKSYTLFFTSHVAKYI